MDNKFFEFILSIIKDKKFYGPILTILISYIIYKLITATLKKVINRGQLTGYELKRRKTIISLVTNVLRYFIIVVDSLIILNIFDVNTTSIIASLGVASAILGFAFQDTIKDFLMGINIILENYFIVGDWIKYSDFLGEVISFDFRCTKIRNFNNEILTIANRNISDIINLSQSKAGIIINIPVAYEEKTAEVEKSIQKILKQLNKNKSIITGTPTYLGVSKLDSSSVNYMIKFLSDHDKQWQTERDALKIIKDVFEEDNIKIPYNQIEVHNGKKL